MKDEIVGLSPTLDANVRHGVVQTVKRILISRRTLLALRLVIGAVFVASGLGKLYDPRPFATAVGMYAFLPDGLKAITIAVLPWAELVAGAYVAMGLFLTASLFLVSLMLGIFAAAIGIVMSHGTNIDCGCFGPIGASMGPGHLAVDLLLLLATLFVLVQEDRSLSVDGWVFGGTRSQYDITAGHWDS